MPATQVQGTGHVPSCRRVPVQRPQQPAPYQLGTLPRLVSSYRGTRNCDAVVLATTTTTLTTLPGKGPRCLTSLTSLTQLHQMISWPCLVQSLHTTRLLRPCG